MKVPVEATGGLVVQTDTYHNPVFKESMKRVFARPGEPTHLGLSSNATFEVSLAVEVMSAAPIGVIAAPA